MKFSIIVPVYNAEKSLEKCILSIIHQSYDNWELILVDDGSEDNSARIAEEYVEKDNRIIVIHQKNAGPGIARNNGIKKATGDYVIFVDSDDYIDEDYFTLLAPKAKNSDVVFIDVLQITPEGKILSKELMSEYKGWSKDRILRSQMTGKVPWGGVRKTVRLSILKDNNIKYTNHMIGEEALYSFKVVHATRSINFLDEKPVYYYVNHEGSQSKIFMEDPWGGVVDTIADYLKEKRLYKEYANTINAFAITALVVSLDRITNSKISHKAKRIKIKARINKFENSFNKNISVDYDNMDNRVKIIYPLLNRNLIGIVEMICKIKGMIK